MLYCSLYTTFVLALMQFAVSESSAHLVSQRRMVAQSAGAWWGAPHEKQVSNSQPWHSTRLLPSRVHARNSHCTLFNQDNKRKMTHLIYLIKPLVKTSLLYFSTSVSSSSHKTSIAEHRPHKFPELLFFNFTGIYHTLVQMPHFQTI